ncbi:hypothetical protein FDG2_4996 [Candidatus Protofrankia californiensis]|uniref:Uncharacterized protein n=1 Tax=Candidatus Protofrankia californiensis TaxID=1839754 RepID=A0A1C3PAE2_9ACTN|nr:hypothetical protein FDG2_4996 [Candidatus Protofrankia californiensis]
MSVWLVGLVAHRIPILGGILGGRPEHGQDRRTQMCARPRTWVTAVIFDNPRYLGRAGNKHENQRRNRWCCQVAEGAAGSL